MSLSRERRNRRVALWFLLPNLIGFLLFTLWPVIAALGLSFMSWDLLTPPQWVGWDNFVQLLGFHRDTGGWVANDPLFWQYLGNTFFMMLSLPINMAGSLGLAMLLNRKLPGIYLYRLVFFFPSILAGVAIFYLWRWIFNADYGLLNNLLGALGIDGPDWLGSVAWAKPALMLMGSWMTVGGTSMILYLAALQNVPVELHEAAQVDGANAWQRFRVVTWPSIMPVTFFIFTMGLIYGLQGGFDSAFIMTGGGPNGSTTTIGFYIYQKAYLRFEMGYASAVAWVLFVLVLGLTLINRRRGGAAYLS
ncbi:carbohydrate ABC transporter permease [Synoicihabitans lomoniglobus]|uniref:Sugar ABC transporter permease n=1 Tax=Synoicihabitans lomoniglobus TaxID=2909285 RepID=A0AAE9ZX85_9BACT|nr:sugar ABC transporter permease [Opitutaceae bacterium LMO-M01]WED64208.1 sugar ABC transporter permease [Opitutaceae bacterium LMO-M01]